MTIEESDFRLTPMSNDSNFWDLEFLHTVKSRSGEIRQEFKNAAYGLTLESAIKRIVHYRCINKRKNDALNMNEYLKLYRQELQNLTKYLNGNILSDK